jgi:nucleoside permease NupC
MASSALLTAATATPILAERAVSRFGLEATVAGTLAAFLSASWAGMLL